MNNQKTKKSIYLVGGAVRDMLMGITISDKDYVAVGYSADEFSHLQQVGKDFPVFIQDDGSELALARLEKKIGSGYNGFEIDTKNVSIEDDLKRRDLSINSIAYNEQEKIIIDPYNGQADIEKKVLRHTSDAFCEDPLRVIRLARFRAKFGYEWKIDSTTKVLVYSMRDELKSLQPDRLWKEIDKVLALEESGLFFETLFELGVLDVVFPHIYTLTTLREGSKYHREANLFVHTMMVLNNLKNSSPLLKLTAIYHDIAKPYCYRRYGNGSRHDKKELVAERIDMHIPTKLKNRMLFLIENHIRVSILDEMKPSKIATFFENFRRDRELLIELLNFYDADNSGRICDAPLNELDKDKILKTFDAIVSYSPKIWISTHDTRPSNQAIAQHIHHYNIKVVKEIFK
jgi:tRNA nucleotidyltransferase (CCA-adding enzyme)